MQQLTFPDGGVLHLEARSIDGNIARSYSIHAQADLFGWTIVERQWGRIGAKGQTKSAAFETLAAADVHIRTLLGRRATARTRIGVAYHPTSGDAGKTGE